MIALPERAAEPNLGRYETDLASVSPGYFATLQIPLVEGRGFAASDRAGAPAVAIINQTLARQLWPGEDPIGRRLNTGSLTNGVPTEIVGVAADAKYRHLAEEPVPMLYLPLPREFDRRITLAVRTVDGAAPSLRAIRDAVHELDPELPVGQQASFAAIIGIALLPNRIALLLAVAFGATGLLLAALGLYGLLAFRVQSRRKEIGIRLALGASARQIRRLVVGEGVRLTAIGLACGLGIAGAIARLLGSMLFGVSPVDPLTYGGIALLLLAVGWFAAMGPTRRALRTDPVEVLRHE
jgi:predicted permease